jgi:hypothetical protein
MKIQFNTDKTISGDEKSQEYFTAHIAEKLSRFDLHITRIEVHLSDENGNKKGIDDIQCLMEARMEARQPIAVSCQAGTSEAAVSGAINKLKAAMDTIIGRIQSQDK